VLWVDVDFVEMVGQIGQNAEMLEASHILFFQTLEFLL
jgi:hypothetical protein